MDLSKSQLINARRAAARFYRAGGRYRRDEYRDVLQDARVAALTILATNPNLYGKGLEQCIYFRLIDKHRKETGCRYRKNRGLAPLCFYTNPYDESGNCDERLINPLIEKAIRDWDDSQVEKTYRVKCELNGQTRTVTIPENVLETAILLTLNAMPKMERECVTEYYYDGKSMKKIGEAKGRCESRVSQIITNFKNRLRACLIYACME